MIVFAFVWLFSSVNSLVVRQINVGHGLVSSYVSLPVIGIRVVILAKVGLGGSTPE